MLFQENTTVQWDPSFIDRYPDPLFQIYGLALVVIVIVMLVRLIGLWVAAPPFSLSRHTNDPGFIDRLVSTRNSMWHWMGCVALGSALVACTQLMRQCNALIPFYF